MIGGFANRIAWIDLTSGNVEYKGIDEEEARKYIGARGLGDKFVFDNGPEVEPLSPENAAALTQMMVGVVESGTGTAAQIPGVTVAGKTGTAQHGDGENPHAWFVCFAPAEAPQIAVAVIVLDGGSLGSEATGGQVAAPIARAVLEAGLGA